MTEAAVARILAVLGDLRQRQRDVHYLAARMVGKGLLGELLPAAGAVLGLQVDAPVGVGRHLQGLALMADLPATRPVALLAEARRLPALSPLVLGRGQAAVAA